MKHVNKIAARVLDALTVGLREAGDSTKFDAAPGAFMAVHVENIGDLDNLGPQFSVCHYYEQNGDLMRDPEMIFLRGADRNYYPVYFRQDGLGVERFSVRRENGQTMVLVREQADEAVFAGTWMRNIKAQQGVR